MTAPTEAKNILVVDDHKPVRQMVRACLQREHYEVLVAEDGESALQLAETSSPHLILLDLSLPGLDGLEVCRRLRGWYEGPIMVLSAHSEEETVVDALDIGADDYITKPFRPLELLARIRALLRRSEDQGRSPVIETGDLRIDLARREVVRSQQRVKLTRTEFDILACLAKDLDHVVSSERILREVWGPHHGEYAQTLRVHMGHIRRKLEADRVRPYYIVTEPGVGYRLRSAQTDRRADEVAAHSA